MRDIEDYAQQYKKTDFETEYQVKYRRKKVLELMAKYPHDNFLEIGCGLEPLAAFLDDFSKCTIVEPSDTFAARARKLGLSLNGRLRVEQGFFEDVALKLTKERFDYIVCSSLLHEVEQPKNLLSAICTLSSVNSGDTIVHINVPNATSFHRLLAMESGLISNVKALSQRNVLLQQNTVYDMDTLIAMIMECGDNCGKKVEILEKGSFFLKPFTHHQMELCLDEGIFDKQILDGLDRMTKYMPDLGSEIFVNFRLV